MAGFRPKFVLFGDSLTQHSFGESGWGAALQNRYARKVDVVLRGYSGYNTRWALYLLPKLFPATMDLASSQGPMTLVTVFFGANDAALPGRTSGKQHVPVEEYASNLVKIVNAIKACSQATEVILITPPPVDEPGRMRYAREMYKEQAMTEPERLNVVTGEYAEACRGVAARLNLPVVDLWTKMQEQPSWQSLLSDGLHFTPKGNEVVFREVETVVKSSFPSLAWDKMPWDFPEHTAIDGGNPASAFQQF